MIKKTSSPRLLFADNSLLESLCNMAGCRAQIDNGSPLASGSRPAGCRSTDGLGQFAQDRVPLGNKGTANRPAAIRAPRSERRGAPPPRRQRQFATVHTDRRDFH
ncbi:hypothetical protein AB0F81_12270 [Actinoplanes sp. NPDC024001]|uniref:hypothetical protein n=1 Tax=Actinoplanes sp. NPDC024001 TaxID=3154598 RepID=UPI0033EAD9B2